MRTLKFYQRCVPDVGTDELLCVKLSQTVGAAELGSPYTRAEGTLYLRPTGPRLRLEPDEIAGCFPSPGSTTCPDEFLPHVALRRRTLPWERRGPVADQDVPWMSILLLSADDQIHSGWKFGDPLDWKIDETTLGALPAALKALYFEEADDQPVTVLDIREGLLREVMGPRAQVALRACLLRLPADDMQGNDDEDGDVALVISPRLPYAGKDGEQARQHTALLVSLEGRSDLPWPDAAPDPRDDERRHQLVVLHRWSFTPSQDGDFEYIMKCLRHHPQGGVLRFGWLPDAQTARPGAGDQRRLLSEHGGLTLKDEIGRDVTYRGPLRESAALHRSPRIALRGDADELDAMADGLPDVSEVAAFELGRLLMLGDPATLASLDEVRRAIDPDPSLIDLDGLPPALRRWRDGATDVNWSALVHLDSVSAAAPFGSKVISASLAERIAATTAGEPNAPSVDLSRADALTQLSRAFPGLRQRT